MMQARNPYSGDNDYSFAAADRAAVAEACRRARARQPEWSALPVGERCAVLKEFAAALAAGSAVREQIFDALSTDTGRDRETNIELDSTSGALLRWAERAPQLLQAQPQVADGPVASQTHADPYQLVGVISPWNLPLMLSFIDAIPALAAGCAVAIKPSEVTPRFVEPLAEYLQQSPWLADLVQLLPGDGSTGAALIEEIDTLCFTGSVATGRKLAVQAAERFIPASLELGGKDPALVLPGADLDKAVPAVLFGGVSNAGQSCLGIERVYVHRSLHDEFAERLAHLADRLSLNWPDKSSGEIGPIISAQQVEIVRQHLDEALAGGAEALAGGALEEHGGVWCQPTVLVNTDADMKVVAEETFAPILPVMPFTEQEEAVQLANDTPYGLSAAVFGPEQEARSVAGQLRAGGVSINDTCLTMITHSAEKQAYGYSGLGGSRMGDVSIRRFYRTQARLHNQIDGPNPWWYAALQTEQDSGSTAGPTTR